jgi:hypothetical protein
MSNQVSKLKKRLLQGIKAKCVDGVWSADDMPIPEPLLVSGYTRGLQCWKDGEMLDELDERDESLPDVDALNEQIPQNEWRTGLNGQPEPPWRIVYVVYLTDMETAELYTWINSGYGAMLAYEALTDKIERMTRMHGNWVTEIVKLGKRPMKVKKLNITKQRPHFEHVDWRDLGPPPSQAPAQLPPPTDKDPTGAAAQPPAEKKKPIVGKPVQPVTAKKELDDDLPF